MYLVVCQLERLVRTFCNRVIKLPILLVWNDVVVNDMCLMCCAAFVFNLVALIPIPLFWFLCVFGLGLPTQKGCHLGLEYS